MGMEPGDIVSVFGHGLMRVTEVDLEALVFAAVDHGPKKATGRWFRFESARVLPEAEARAALAKEREEARARNVACNNPDCWCIGWLDPAGARWSV